MSKLKVLELFGGIGACSKALERLGIDYEIVDCVEIDKYAIKSFNAIHNTTFEPQDICKWNKNIEVDLIMHGSPCQDFSVAGLQAGGDKDSGTRSSLMYETLRIVENLKPKYVIWENVKNIISKKHKHNFDNYITKMNNLGYNNYFEVLNAKDFEIPQNRERVFTISIRNDIKKDFVFPEKKELNLKLKDMLETQVDKKYFLDNDKSKSFINKKYNKFIEKNEYVPEMFNPYNTTEIKDIAPTQSTQCGSTTSLATVLKCIRIGGIFDTETQKHQAGSVYDKEGLCPTLDVMAGGWRQPSIIEYKEYSNFYVIPRNSDGKLINDSYNRIWKEDKYIGSINLTKIQEIGKKDNDLLLVRKLTPLECWRLMGFDDEDFNKAKATGNSDSQLYKQAGNSIVVNVLENILKNLIV